MPFDLIIWDCDGCLVDSEVLACEALADYLGELGYFLSVEAVMDRFIGKNDRDTIAEIEQETGKPYTKLFSYHVYRQKVFSLFEKALAPISGVADAIGSIGGSRCIASGSSLPRVFRSLELTGLSSFFAQDQIFSTAAEDLRPDEPKITGKPAPDVFLYAAMKMRVAPEKCLVIEDSAHGIAGGLAAGMTVFAFTGGSHIRPRTIEAIKAANPHKIFSDMRNLPSLTALSDIGASAC